MEEFEGLSKIDLLLELKKAESELEDVEEMRLFILGQTGVHLGAARAKSLQGTWDRDEARLRSRIEAIKSRLQVP